MAMSPLIPLPAEPKPDPMVPTTLNLDAEDIAWLDSIAERTKRSRSDVARQIFRAVREQEARKKS